MANRSLAMTDRLYGYLLSVSLREEPILAELRKATAELPEANMQIAPEQGQFMRLLVELTGARRVLEVGTFTGYSALAVALSLPADGRILCCDISEDFTRTARDFWTRAGVAERIELRLGPALETLDTLLSEGEEGRFDFVFIDADKANYDGYYERALKLVRPGGLIALDNMLWGGAVAEPSKNDEDTLALRALNEKLHEDPRISLSLLPLADGLALALRR